MTILIEKTDDKTEVLAPPVGEVLTAETVKLLWMMHVRGPDDVYPAPDYETAVKWCDYINYRLAPRMPDIITSAVPGIWIYSAEQHAASLAQAIAGWTMPLNEDGTEQVVIPKLSASLAAPTVQEGEDLGLLACGSIPTEQSASGSPHQQPQEHAYGRPALTGSLLMKLRMGSANHSAPVSAPTDSGR